jgi:hypothetical protein
VHLKKIFYGYQIYFCGYWFPKIIKH